MKAFFNKQKTLLISAVVFTATGIFAQDGDFSKEIKKEFPVNENTRLEVLNKFGNIDIVRAESSLLTIEVNVRVDTRDDSRAQDLLNMINIDIFQEGDVIKAITEISEDFGKHFRGFNTQNNGMEINYKISMPDYVPLNLSNKYGNVFIDQLVSTSIIDIKYGKFTANKILHDSKEPLTKVYLSYSQGSIQETKWIEADIKYSKLNISYSKALAILSKYSKVYINNGSSIVSESKYDTYEIEKLTNLVATAAYGHYNIGILSGKLQVDTKYTDVIIDNIPSSFDGIKVTNSYGTYKLGIEPSASYRIDAYAKYCNISYPEERARVNRINENNEMKINGRVGDSPEPKAEVSVNSHYGSVRLIP